MYIKNVAILAPCLLIACTGTPEPSNPQTSVKSQFAHSHETLTYPKTKMDHVVDTYFGVEVADPYRWLENDRSAETSAWVKAQNQLTFHYLEKIPYRERLKQRLQDSWNYAKRSAPFTEGGVTYYYHNNGLQNYDVVYRLKGEAKPEVFLDPNQLSEDSTTSLAGLEFSRDGRYAAYAISEGGSDWRKIIVLDTQTKLPIEDPIVNVKFSNIAWRGNEGFYYSSYDKPKGSELSATTDQHKVYFHRLGETQVEDSLIFGGIEAQKRRYASAEVTADDRYLLIYSANSTSGNDLYIKDLATPHSRLVPMLDNFDSDTSLITNSHDKLLLLTNLDAPNQKVVAVSAKNPTLDQWQQVIPETDQVLTATAGGGYLFAEYMVDTVSKVYQYDYDGKRIREVALPGLGTATSIEGKPTEKTLYYSFTNYYTPSTIYSLAVETGQSTIYHASAAKFDPDQYTGQQVFYPSKDGTTIPMLITHKKDLKLDGNNPTILYGYGGFNISITPYFSISNAVWMNHGGIYAVANLRGGGEYGKAWHKAGTLQQKQNVFDDFIAAAEYLIANQYTSNKRLAILGRSNGGLLVGAVMTQRPELMQVALPAVGVMDMLRYHTFTAGAGWAYDYGTAAQSKAMFEYLKSYSPVHNVKAGVHYPATLVTTADHDDRVVPAHSFKFTAELQTKQAGHLPTLIRIETSAGHGAGTPVFKRIEQAADIFAFTLFNMGIETLPEPR